MIRRGGPRSDLTPAFADALVAMAEELAGGARAAAANPALPVGVARQLLGRLINSLEQST